MVDERRVRILKEAKFQTGPVVYIMGRDFRVEDNWALLYAQELALKHKVPLAVLVHFGKNIVETNARQHDFLIDGLQEVAAELESLKIPFFITYGDWQNEFSSFIKKHEVGAIVTDFSPLHELRFWWDEVSEHFELPIYEVDAHNIIPCWLASDKEEYAARTFRPKVRKLYRQFSGDIPAVQTHPHMWPVSTEGCWPRGADKHGCALIDWHGVKAMRSFDVPVAPITWLHPGPKAAHRVLKKFITDRLSGYAKKRNDPNEDVVSNLSPYIRHGFISTQRIAKEIEAIRGKVDAKKAFLEEMVVRRELAENFCFYNDQYDSFNGLRDWAKKTLDEHRKDKRDYVYTLEQFEAAETHDPLWNAAQLQLIKTGKMHGYMRMYWAKKILEWTKTPEEAIEFGILLNDRYSIDGRDPNGYVGVLWSVGGIHDRAWFERPIFGKIRYMNDKGAKRKFDTDAYIAAQLGKPLIA